MVRLHATRHSTVTRPNRCAHRVIWAVLPFVWFASSTVHAQTLEGFTEPNETIKVASAESGIVRSIELREGDRISRGQIICVLDNEVLKASLDSAQARAENQGKLAAATATLKLRELRHEKFLALNAEGHASPEEVERAANDLTVARANLLAAREQSEQDEFESKRIEAQIERRTIRSPIDGVIVRISKKPGELVTAGDSLIATVVQLTVLRVRFYLPTRQATELRLNDSVDLALPDTDQQVQGRIAFISPVTDSDSGTVRVEVMIDNASARYRSGIRCVIRSKQNSTTSLHRIHKDETRNVR